MTHEERQSYLEASNKALNTANYAEAERLAHKVQAFTDPALIAEVEDHTSAVQLLGTIALRRGDHSLALERYTFSLGLSERAADRAGVAKALYNIGNVHFDLSDYPLALEDYAKALSIGEELDDKAGVARNLCGIGNVHLNRSDYPNALEYYERALSLAEELDNKAAVASNLGNIGIVHANLTDYPKALECFSQALSIDEELSNKAGVATNLGHMGLVHESLSDYPKALEYYAKTLSIAEELDNKKLVAAYLSNIGIVHLNLSDYPKALECFAKALSLQEELGNKAGVANNLGNIGIVHKNLSDYPKALEYYARALSLADELGNKKTVATNLGNIGLVHMYLSDYPKALEYFAKALSIDEDLGNKAGVARHLGNIGVVHTELTDHPSALEYYSKALSLAEELGNTAGVALYLASIGSVHEGRGEFERALANYSRALHIHEEQLGQKSEAANDKARIGSLYAIAEWAGHDEPKAEAYLLDSIAMSQQLGQKKYDVHRALAELYERQKRWEEFAVHYKKYNELKEEVQSQEAKNSAVQMEQRRQIAEREKEIAIAKAAADAKMSATTTLLYKVLPESVATRMIEGEEEIADYFPQVSILFADIAGFTPISADMPAIVVVRFLNYVFREFDRIIKKHGCEKIKTIGDGYMAVCGAPVECADHAERLAAAALEMQETITLPESIREFMPAGSKLGVRIGLHTGSVVAGVIGEERFVYDIYSDAVNTASRMESHGEENKIHISNDYYRHLQNRFAMTKNTSYGLTFEKRGELEIKGKGPMRTYYLEKA